MVTEPLLTWRRPLMSMIRTGPTPNGAWVRRGPTMITMAGSTSMSPISPGLIRGTYPPSPVMRIPANSRMFPIACPPDRYPGEQGILYHNNGDGTFTDVTAKGGPGPRR